MKHIRIGSILFILFFSSIVILIVFSGPPDHISDHDPELVASAEEIRELIAGKSFYKHSLISGTSDRPSNEERYEPDGTFKSISLPLSQRYNTVRLGTWEIVTRDGVATIRTKGNAYHTIDMSVRSFQSERLVFDIKDDQSSRFIPYNRQTDFTDRASNRTPPRTEFTYEDEFNRLLRLATR